MANDNEELETRIRHAENDLSFFSRFGENMVKTGWATEEELNDAINETLDDFIDAKSKLN